MNKPTKKGFLVGKNTGNKNWEISVCNKSCDEWETFLPDVEEIRKLILRRAMARATPLNMDFVNDLAKEIAGRIGK